MTNSTVVKPLPQVVEAKESQEIASIDVETRQAALQKRQTVDDPNMLSAGIDKKRFSTEVAPVARS